MELWPFNDTSCGRIIREKDWSAHPLGTIPAWPAELKTTVDLVLACSFPLIVLWGRDLYQFYNDAYATIMESRHPAGMGQRTADCWPEVWDFNRKVYERVLNGQTVDYKDQPLSLLSGSELQQHFFDLCYSPVRSATGSVGGVLVTVFDVTAKHRSDVTLQDNIARLNTLVAATSYSTYIMSADWSVMREINGGGFLANTTGSTRTWLQDYIHPDDQARVLERIEKAISTRSMFELEYRVRLADGSLGWTLSRAVPILGQDGTVKEWFGAASDVTDQYVKAKRQAELAAIVDSSDDVILSKDLNGIITSWNSAATKLFGYQPDEIIGRSILTLIPEHLQSDEEKILTEIRAGRSIEHFETVRQTKAGDLIDVSLTISPVRDSRGTIIGASKILRDISARKRMEESLLQAEKIAATGRMAATIAHEVNNPLEAITNLLYLAKGRVTDTETLGFLQTAEAELSRVSHIAKQTLGYYREHASASRLALSKLVNDAVDIYAPRCRAMGISLHCENNSTLKGLIRRGEMMQVVSNLIANSIYAMSPGDTLSLTTRDLEDGSGVEVAVKDTGSGIPQSVQSKVFDAFFTTRSTIGTGIGLFVAKNFVEGHGGSIRLESSTSPDSHGTTVRFLIPIPTAYETGTTA